MAVCWWYVGVEERQGFGSRRVSGKVKIIVHMVPHHGGVMLTVWVTHSLCHPPSISLIHLPAHPSAHPSTQSTTLPLTHSPTLLCTHPPIARASQVPLQAWGVCSLDRSSSPCYTGWAGRGCSSGSNSSSAKQMMWPNMHAAVERVGVVVLCRGLPEFILLGRVT